MERDNSLKKPNLARLGDLIDYKLLLLKENKKAFRITCIMLILDNLKKLIKSIKARKDFFLQSNPSII